ncbi:hypothetical protein F5Y10DRAFT_48623 [Nemania abortiva]|nr:hypothetical protein F5Y10DRAFT_48623 [Nemania abortiva]
MMIKTMIMIMATCIHFYVSVTPGSYCSFLLVYVRHMRRSCCSRISSFNILIESKVVTYRFKFYLLTSLKSRACIASEDLSDD